MNKLLSIIIPYYKEQPDDLFPLLSSINNQVGIRCSQIEVLLMNDGADKRLPRQWLGQFANIAGNTHNIILKNNRGPGMARQAGIDRANGEYIFFCDADDILHSVADWVCLWMRLSNIVRIS